MIGRIWDWIAERWWASAAVSVLCLSAAVALLLNVHGQSWSLKLSAALGLMGICLAVVTLLHVREVFSPQRKNLSTTNEDSDAG